MNITTIINNPIYGMSHTSGEFSNIEQFNCCPNCGTDWGFNPHPKEYRCKCGVEWKLVEITNDSITYSLLANKDYSIAYARR
jgi:predicted  nucleic acid-binding Zn ribbon protein